VDAPTNRENTACKRDRFPDLRLGASLNSEDEENQHQHKPESSHLLIQCHDHYQTDGFHRPNPTPHQGSRIPEVGLHGFV